MPLIFLLLYSAARPALILREKSSWPKIKFFPFEAIAGLLLSMIVGWLILHSDREFNLATSTVYQNHQFDYPAWISLPIMYLVDLSLVAGIMRSLQKRSPFLQHAFSGILSILLMFTVEFMMLILSSMIVVMLSKVFV